MSRFVDKLTSINQASAPMGFQARQVARSQRRLLLVVSLDKGDFDQVAGDMAGADAALLKTTGVDDIKKAVKKLPELPWGVWLESADSGALTGVAGAGADFVVFTAGSAAGDIIKGDTTGRVLEVGDTLGESWFRAVDRLPVDAVLIGGEGTESLTWGYLMQIQYCADLLAKPVLAFVPAAVTESELQAVWTAGVDGVVVAVAGQPAGQLKEIRRMIDGLKLPEPRRKEKTMAILPRVSAAERGEIEEPGEPEDE